jgi:hypothetical protein
MKKLLLLTLLLATVMVSPVAADDIVGDDYSDLPDNADGCKGEMCWWHGVEEQKTALAWNAHTGENIINTDEGKVRNYFYNNEHIVFCFNYPPAAGGYVGGDYDTDGSQGTFEEISWIDEPYGAYETGAVARDIPRAYSDETLVCTQTQPGSLNPKYSTIKGAADFRDPVEGKGGLDKHDYNFVVQNRPAAYPDPGYTGIWHIPDFYIKSHDDPDNDGISPSTRDGGDDCPNTYGTLPNGCPTSASYVKEYSTPGDYDWTVPEGVEKIYVEMSGASGGDNSVTGDYSAMGGDGGYTEGTIDVTPGETIEINVGGEGGVPDGGFNGGGSSGECTSFNYNCGSAGGGGASDIRVGGGDHPGLSYRAMVAGGGGGAGYNVGGRDGGDGGGLKSEAPYSDEDQQRATQNTGYSKGNGRSVSGTSIYASTKGGGGGGYYGGYSGWIGGWSGSGGSGYCDANLTSGCETIQGEGVADGDGYVEIISNFFLSVTPEEWGYEDTVDATISTQGSFYEDIDTVEYQVRTPDSILEEGQMTAYPSENSYKAENIFTADQKDTRYTLEITVTRDDGATFRQSESKVIKPLDDDGDGTRNANDECPQTFGLEDSGCPDSDDDGLEDRFDECPETFGEKSNGCPNSNPNIEQIYAPDTVEKGSTFSATVSASDADDGQDVSISWALPDNSVENGDNLQTSFSNTGEKLITVRASDGIVTMRRTFSVNVTEIDYPDDRVDIEPDINLTKPSGEIDSSPVNYEFDIAANDGTITVFRSQPNSPQRVIKTFDHTKGEQTYSFTEKSTPVGQNVWQVRYEREVDSDITQSTLQNFNLLGIQDADGDGIRDSLDDCVNTPGSEATNGCPDSDGDGVKDSLDDCPNTYGLKDNGCENTPPTIDSIDAPSEVLEGENFEVSATYSDPDDGQNLTATWTGQKGKLGEGNPTDISLPFPDTWNVNLVVSDGIDSTTQSVSVDALFNSTGGGGDEEDPRPQADMDIEIEPRNPERFKEIPDNPVTYRFDVTANQGELELRRKQTAEAEFETVKTWEHSRGSNTYRFDEEGLEPESYRWAVEYERDRDGETAVTQLRQFDLLGQPDDDGDGIPNSEDECPGSDSTPTFGVKDNGCPNTPPEIDNLDVPDSVNRGEDFTVSVDASDQDQQQELSYDWNNGKSGQEVTGCYNTFGFKSVGVKVDDGVWVTEGVEEIQVEASNKTCESQNNQFNNSYGDGTGVGDGGGESDPGGGQEGENKIPRTNISTKIDLRQPEKGEALDTRSINFNANVTANMGTIKLFMDGERISTRSQPRGTQIHDFYESNFTLGEHEWRVEYERTADGITFSSKTQEFTVTSIPEKEDIEFDDNSTSDGGDDNEDDSDSEDNNYDEGDDVDFNYSINNTYSGNVSLLRNGSVVSKKNLTAEEATVDSFTVTPPAPDDEPVTYCYRIRYTSVSGNEVTSDCEYITVEPVFNNIDIANNDNIYTTNPNQQVTYDFNITTVSGNITLTENGETIFEDEKTETGTKQYSVDSTTSEFAPYFVTVELDNSEGTFTESDNYKVINESESTGGDDGGDDGGGDSGGDDGGDFDDDLVRNITIEPKSWSADNGEEVTREFTVESTLRQDVVLEMSVSGSCESFSFRGINDYSKQVRYNIPSESQNDIPLQVYMPYNTSQNSCEVLADYNGTQETFDFTVDDSVGGEAILDFVGSDVSPLTGSFAESFAFERCSRVNGSIQNRCEEPVTTDVNPAALMGLMILLFISLGGVRSYYREAYKGETSG